MQNTPELTVLRHSASHIMASAVKRLFPDAKFAIGPAIDDGFYYDFDMQNPLQPEDLDAITNEMKKIVNENTPFVRTDVTKQEVITRFEREGETYKVEIIREIPDDTVSLYQHGDFTDLCRGPHVAATGELKHFALLSIAGAYWRGDEKNKMLQRIYGTAFFSKEDLDAHLRILDEAKKRDHRRLGKDLDLFSIQDLGGGGLVYWHPKGSLIRKCIEDFWKNAHLANGYALVNIPHIARIDLWKTSGHWDFYNENMFTPIDVEGQQYILKPMNCPGHILMYKSRRRSYRELPIRWAELGTVYRFERSGVLHGLMRVRGFTQDDAHIFTTPETLEQEIVSVIKLVVYVLSTFGFNDYKVFLSTRPEKYVGTRENWHKAEHALKTALETTNLDYEIDPGEGVFYGPKIDIKIKDCLGRLWQCSTIQVDFALPERFDVTYIGADGNEHRPIMIHRALMGSLERFFGILIEHYAGAFPLWFAPEHVRVLTVSNKCDEYARKVHQQLVAQGIRARLDAGSEKLGYKIRAAQMEKIPYMVVIGEKEAATELLAIRKRTGENVTMSLNEFMVKLEQEIKDKHS